jgi:hypothetical protein
MQNFHVNLSLATALLRVRSDVTAPSINLISVAKACTAAPSNHGEQRRNRDPQAWAEFC